MKKIYIFAAVALLTACSSENLTDMQQNKQVAAVDDAVGFDAYVVRGLTRAGGPTNEGLNDIDATQLRDSKYTFGVFGYYTDNNEYDGTTLPNFFYNQQVTYDSYWKYTPIKYWPNEYGDNAISDDNDKVTFFAYAPYVDFNPSTGKIKTIANGNDQWGIVQASRNTTAGDPWLKYNVSFDGDKQVDLLWGVNKEYASWSTVNGGTQTLNAGLPWLNVQRPLGHGTQSAESQRVKFQFKHALAKLTATIDAVVDDVSGPTTILDDKTRIYVRSITFTGFTTKGMLNLNNTEKDQPLWLEYNGNGDLEPGVETTIYDGRKDGKEGTAGTATNEKVLGLNPQLVQDENQLVNATAPATGKVWSTDASTKHVGVTETAQNLFRQWDSSVSKYVPHMVDYDGNSTLEQGYIYVIPTGEEVQVTIVYDVETISENLPVYLADGKTNGSSIENKITRTVNFGNAGLEAGKAYTLQLHLGMNSVKIDAAVTEWDETTPAQDIHLPNNKTEYAAGVGAAYNYTVPAAGGTFSVVLTGFNGGESISPTKSGKCTDATGSVANATGNLDATFTVSENTSILNLPNTSAATDIFAQWKGSASNKQVKLNITQLAHALGLADNGTELNGDIKIKTDATDGATTDNVKSIKVVRNGVELTKKDGGLTTDAVDQGKFYYSGTGTTGTISLHANEKVLAGDVFEITIQSGDAQAETITIKK